MTERMVTIVEVKHLLEQAEAARGELTYEQKLALEHARKFARFKYEDLSKVMEALRSNPKVDEATAIRIIDMAPHHPDDVRALMAKSRTNLDESEVQKILETVSKYLTS